jgi:hypothetical protein
LTVVAVVLSGRCGQDFVLGTTTAQALVVDAPLAH